jgi:hypothetical protein
VAWTGLFLLSIGTSGGSCEHGNEPSDSTKYGEVPEQLLIGGLSSSAQLCRVS